MDAAAASKRTAARLAFRFAARRLASKLAEMAKLDSMRFAGVSAILHLCGGQRAVIQDPRFGCKQLREGIRRKRNKRASWLAPNSLPRVPAKARLAAGRRGDCLELPQVLGGYPFVNDS